MRRARAVLVTGATGMQGGAVAEHLLARGHRVRAFVRQRRSARAQQLAALGAELVEGDYDVTESIVAAAAGMEGMFAVGTPFEGGVDAEVRQGRALIEAAKKARVGYFVYSSVASADRHTGVPHFESKHRVEAHLKKSGLPFTVVGPTFFRENQLGAIDAMAVRGLLTLPLAPERSLQTLDRDDLGTFVAGLFDGEPAHLGQRIDLASDSTTGPEMALHLGRALGRPIRYLAEGVDEVMVSDDDLGRMWAWLNRVGYAADLTRLHREYRDVRWRGFEEWARDTVGERLTGIAL